MGVIGATSNPPHRGPKASSPGLANTLGAASKPIATASSQESTDDVKLQKAKTMAAQLLDEWSGLSKGKQRECIEMVADQFAEKVPGKLLALMAETFYVKLDVSDLQVEAEEGEEEDEDGLATAERELTGPWEEEHVKVEGGEAREAEY